MQETQVQSLGWEDSLEKKMATTPVFLTGKFHGQGSLEHYSPKDGKESDTTEWLSIKVLEKYIYEVGREWSWDDYSL